MTQAESSEADSLTLQRLSESGSIRVDWTRLR
jgi:hypothetical protein